MTAVTVLLMDSRLQSNRQMRTEVTFNPINLSAPQQAHLEPIFLDLTGSYEYAEPVTLDLAEGIWFIEFASYLGNKVSSPFEVSATDFRLALDAAKLERGYSAPKSDTYRRLEPKKRFGAPVLARKESMWKLVPSSGGIDRGRTHSSDDLIPRIFLREYLYRNTDDFAHVRKKQFHDLASFDERFEYWMRGWECAVDATELRAHISSKQNSELMTSRTCVHLGCRDRQRPSRSVLAIHFSDERYIFVLPVQFDSVERSSTVDVEIDFYGSPTRGASARIVQARVLTNESRFNGVLQQLSVGSLYNARNLWVEGARRLLFEKYSNPIAAAAGALILVQPDVFGNKDLVAEKERLKDWFANLFRDFHWLPEGAICVAWLYGAGVDPFSSRSIDDPKHMIRFVSDYLFEAVERGLPFYTEGLRLLSQGVEWAEDLLNTEIVSSVRWLSTSSVRAGPFLLIRDCMKEGR